MAWLGNTRAALAGEWTPSHAVKALLVLQAAMTRLSRIALPRSSSFTQLVEQRRRAEYAYVVQQEQSRRKLVPIPRLRIGIGGSRHSFLLRPSIQRLVLCPLLLRSETSRELSSWLVLRRCSFLQILSDVLTQQRLSVFNLPRQLVQLLFSHRQDCFDQYHPPTLKYGLAYSK